MSGYTTDQPILSVWANIGQYDNIIGKKRKEANQR